MKTSDIPSWFWETDQEPRDEILHIGPELEEQRWVSNGHVMLRVDPAEKGDMAIVPPAKAGTQAPLKYAHLMLVAAMTELVSEASGTMLRRLEPAYLIVNREGYVIEDFACTIGDRAFGLRYVAWIDSLGDLTWTQSGSGPAYAINSHDTVFAVVQALILDVRPQKIDKDRGVSFSVTTNATNDSPPRAYAGLKTDRFC